MTRIECFKFASDDWYGNFKIAEDQRYKDRKLVKVSFLRLSDGTYRTCVWGNDDFGMEFDAPLPRDARAVFDALMGAAEISAVLCRSYGMVRA